MGSGCVATGRPKSSSDSDPEEELEEEDELMVAEWWAVEVVDLRALIPC